MKNFFVITILFSVSACAALPKAQVPELQNRRLRISKEVPGFYYQWKECTKKGLFGGCKEQKIVVEYFDLREPEVRNKLRDMGFTATSERKIKP